MYRQALLVLLAAVGGSLIGALVIAHLAPGGLAAGPPAAPGSLSERLTLGKRSNLDPNELARIVESLVEVLDQEIAERHILAEQLEDLRSEMSDLQENLRIRVEAAFADERNAADEVQIDSGFQPDFQVEQTVEGRLAAAGFTPQQVEHLRRREAEAQMRQVELDDQARREGWANTPRHMEEMSRLMNAGNGLRQELGDDAYDRYLHATGRPNRIAVGNVIPYSPAAQAGLQPGDIIVSYGGQRVFSPMQLNDQRSAGIKGAPVTVEIVRNGERMEITMPRGPMGVQPQPYYADPRIPEG